MSSLLSIKQMSINFDTPRGSLEAVRGVDIEIPAGMSVGVVGESGSGKTVMCRAAMGLLQGSNVKRSGTVVFDGHELTSMTKEQVRDLFGSGMAMIFQDPMTALNSCKICACTVTSSAVVGSSANKSFGLHAIAMAIITR
ncbi:ATP-binding cassette domain-containing protein [bacterium]|nr:ATP-binding cassette domain-containing protein [bacterium]